MGSYLVRWLISNIIICHRWTNGRANGWTEDQSLTINSEIPIYKIHIPCMAWPFPYFPRFQWLTIYRPSILVSALFIFLCSSLILYASRFYSVALNFSLCFFCVSHFHHRPRSHLELPSTSAWYHHNESIETLFGNSIVIYWLPIDLLQRNERRCERWPTPKTKTWTKKLSHTHKVALNPFRWITWVFMHLIESYWICIRYCRTFYSVSRSPLSFSFRYKWISSS